MSYVYILSDYGEDGAEHVRASVDRHNLMKMLREGWTETKETMLARMPYLDGARAQERANEFNIFLSEYAVNLEAALGFDDADLAERCRENGIALAPGRWGHVQLHVIELE